MATKMNAILYFLLGSAAVLSVQAELVQMQENELSDAHAQSGITIDVDVSGVSFSYAYTNNENTSEDHWIVGKNAGSDVVKVEGITLDVAAIGGGNAIIIGLPTVVTLKNVNTGDYFIADETAAGSPPIQAAVSETTGGGNINKDRKLFGLKWNTPIEFTFSGGAAATSVGAHDFSQYQYHGTGSVMVVAD